MLMSPLASVLAGQLPKTWSFYGRCSLFLDVVLRVTVINLLVSGYG